MSAYLDRIIAVVIDNIKKSGLLAQGTLSGTVSAVGTDGTVTVTRNADTYPKVQPAGVLHKPCRGPFRADSSHLGWLGVSRTTRHLTNPLDPLENPCR